MKLLGFLNLRGISGQIAALVLASIVAIHLILTTTFLINRPDQPDPSIDRGHNQLLAVAQLPEVPVALEHLRHVDPHTRIVVGYRLDATPAESPRLRRRLALPPDPRITLHFDEVVIPGASGRFWSAMRWDTPGLKTGDRPAAPHR